MNPLKVSLFFFTASFLMTGLLIRSNNWRIETSHIANPDQVKLKITDNSVQSEEQSSVINDPLVKEAKQNLAMCEIFLLPLKELKTPKDISDFAIGIEYSEKLRKNIESLTESEVLMVLEGKRERLQALLNKMDKLNNAFPKEPPSYPQGSPVVLRSA